MPHIMGFTVAVLAAVISIPMVFDKEYKHCLLLYIIILTIDGCSFLGQFFLDCVLLNQELRNKILPSTEAYGMPYIYDNFLWEHCDSVGVHFKKI